MKDFVIERDALIRLEPAFTRKGGTTYTRKTTLITKDEFIMAYQRWIKEEANG